MKIILYVITREEIFLFNYLYLFIKQIYNTSQFFQNNLNAKF